MAKSSFTIASSLLAGDEPKTYSSGVDTHSHMKYLFFPSIAMPNYMMAYTSSVTLQGWECRFLLAEAWIENVTNDLSVN